MKRALLLALALAVGCGSPSPKLVAPDSVESFCPGAAPRGAAIVSVLSSVADAIEPVDVPSDSAVRKQIADDGGVIAHWKAEPLYMPGTAHALGVSGDYIEVSQVAIANALVNPDTRIIYVTVASPQGTKRLPLLAYDTRNICSSAPSDND